MTKRERFEQRVRKCLDKINMRITRSSDNDGFAKLSYRDWTVYSLFLSFYCSDLCEENDMDYPAWKDLFYDYKEKIVADMCEQKFGVCKKITSPELSNEVLEWVTE